MASIEQIEELLWRCVLSRAQYPIDRHAKRYIKEIFARAAMEIIVSGRHLDIHTLNKAQEDVYDIMDEVNNSVQSTGNTTIKREFFKESMRLRCPLWPFC